MASVDDTLIYVTDEMSSVVYEGISIFSLAYLIEWRNYVLALSKLWQIVILVLSFLIITACLYFGISIVIMGIVWITEWFESVWFRVVRSWRHAFGDDDDIEIRTRRNKKRSHRSDEYESEDSDD